MDWTEDFKFSLKKSAKKGRRAAASSSLFEKESSTTSTPEQEQISLEKDMEEDLNDFDIKPLSKKVGGWADEALKFGKNSKTNTNLIEQERFNSITSTTNYSDDEIPVIPDLDDIQDDLILNEMVDAPMLSINRVATYKELNTDLLKQGAFASLDDVDLSILARCLQNEAVLDEPDEIWTWEKLFTQVSAAIHSDKPHSADAPTTKFVN